MPTLEEQVQALLDSLKNKDHNLDEGKIIALLKKYQENEEATNELKAYKKLGTLEEVTQKLEAVAKHTPLAEDDKKLLEVVKSLKLTPDELKDKVAKFDEVNGKLTKLERDQELEKVAKTTKVKSALFKNITKLQTAEYILKGEEIFVKQGDKEVLFKDFVEADEDLKELISFEEPEEKPQGNDSNNTEFSYIPQKAGSDSSKNRKSDALETYQKNRKYALPEVRK